MSSQVAGSVVSQRCQRRETVIGCVPLKVVSFAVSVSTVAERPGERDGARAATGAFPPITPVGALSTETEP